MSQKCLGELVILIHEPLYILTGCLQRLLNNHCWTFFHYICPHSLKMNTINYKHDTFIKRYSYHVIKRNIFLLLSPLPVRVVFLTTGKQSSNNTDCHFFFWCIFQIFQSFMPHGFWNSNTDSPVIWLQARYIAFMHQILVISAWHCCHSLSKSF